MVNNAMEVVDIATSKNTDQRIFIRFAYCCNHSLIKYHAIGEAIRKAIRISFRKSTERIEMILGTEAPITFLIPISLVRLTAASAVSPNNPRHARRMEIPPAQPTIRVHLSSFL